MLWDTIVVGAGAAGMMSAIRAAQRGRRVLLLEKNRKPGVKILISGGTRCNLTHNTDERGIVQAFGRQGRFLHSALAQLSPAGLVAFFHAEGVPTKVEPTGKIFPTSDRAWDVQQALIRCLHRAGVELRTGLPVLALSQQADHFLVLVPGSQFQTKTVVITTGGQSYPGCGTTGDGYAWLAAWQHTIVPTCPALVPLTTTLDWTRALAGVTIPDLAVDLVDTTIAGKGSCLDRRRGSFLFTHRGVSGPVVMDLSRHVGPHAGSPLTLHCDFLRGQSAEATLKWLAQQAVRAGGRSLAATLDVPLPRRLVDTLWQLCCVPLDRKGSELTKQERQRLAQALRATPIPISGSLGFAKAEVTAGGVALDEVHSQTMESKRVAGLYLAGEVLDLDGPIGGYNFQAAFSTGYLAGDSV